MTQAPPHRGCEFYDLIVIGGGINGAAIARDAAMRKLKVVLIEKRDFGSGASSKTSKLVHGGVRYLEQFQFSLVREALNERSLLIKNAPHLVKPLPFLLPVYKEDPHSLWKVNLGLYFYDFLAGNADFPKHARLQAKDILIQVPGLKSEGLCGGCSYFDAQMLDNRIVIENILSAEREGAKVCNYTEAVGLLKENNQLAGVSYRNDLTGEQGEIYGKILVNATGAWSSKIIGMEPDANQSGPRPTKGVHLIIPQILPEAALLLRSPKDGRVFFILPWGDYSLVGTTDTFFQGNYDHVTVEEQDKSYLLDAVNAFFPEKQLTTSSIISSFAGLRPLVDSTAYEKPSSIFREHTIQVSKSGLITLLGGKYTTHRLIAEEVVDTVVIQLNGIKSFLPCKTKIEPLPGAAGPFSLLEVKEALKLENLDNRLITHLLNTYGTESLAILKIIKQRPEEAEPILKNHPQIFAELTYSVQYEHLKKLEDWFLRQNTNIYQPDEYTECRDRIEQKLMFN